GGRGLVREIWREPEISASGARATAASTGTLGMAALFPSGVSFTRPGFRRRLAHGGSPGPRIADTTSRPPFSPGGAGAALPASVGLIRLYPHLSADAR